MQPDPIANHYARPALLDTILAALASAGRDIGSLTVDDLAPVDEFHIRGREATVELAEMAAPEPHWHVADIGSGLGGSSRYLAQRYGCRVTGIDLTPGFCDTAAELTRRTGLHSLVEFRCASALEMPFPDACIDLAWTQHVQMNIAAKEDLYREIARVVKPGGLFAFHDILAGSGGPPHYPVHWAGEPAISHLIAPDPLADLLSRAGFRTLVWRDTTAIAHRWYVAALERARNRPPDQPAPPGLQLLLGGDVAAKFANVARNLEEGRITVYQGLLERW